MSKSPARQRAIHPVVPTVSAGSWKALIAAADEFNHLAPWQWMHDSHVIGMRWLGTQEVLLGSILGRLRQVFALLVYRNEAGRRWLLNTILNDGDSGGLDRVDTAFEQDLVKVEFVKKRELAKEDQAALTAGGGVRAAQRGHRWPQFRSLVPGGCPWHVTQGEAELLLFALPRVAAVARLLQAHPHAWDAHCDGEIAFLPDTFDPAAGPLRPEQMEWQPMFPPPEPPAEPVVLDEATLARLLELEPAQGFRLELDVSYAPFPIATPDRPRFPLLAMAVDRASGFVGGFHLGDFKDRDGAGALGVVLRNALTQLGHRPEAFHVQRPRAASMLRNVAGELGIPVCLEAELAALNFARESMKRHFEGCR